MAQNQNQSGETKVTGSEAGYAWWLAQEEAAEKQRGIDARAQQSEESKLRLVRRKDRAQEIFNKEREEERLKIEAQYEKIRTDAARRESRLSLFKTTAKVCAAGALIYTASLFADNAVDMVDAANNTIVRSYHNVLNYIDRNILTTEVKVIGGIAFGLLALGALGSLVNGDGSSSDYSDSSQPANTSSTWTLFGAADSETKSSYKQNTNNEPEKKWISTKDGLKYGTKTGYNTYETAYGEKYEDKGISGVPAKKMRP
jgi:hypothetical protein